MGHLTTYLTQTKLVESGIFKENLVYPEDACREALINAVAHRDYSIEGKGIEIFIYDDRLEVKSPGGILSSISISDLKSGKRTHQSRNAYMSRVLRELGYMREMGEGILRIYATMRDRDLIPPELDVDATKFDLVLHHKSVFSPKDQEWLQAYSLYNLTRDEQRVILLGKDGHLLSTSEIIKALDIADVDEFRKIVETLRRKGILYTALERSKTAKALRLAGTKREVGRFAIRPPDQTEQYRQELLRVMVGIGSHPTFRTEEIRAVSHELSSGSPYKENLPDSLKLLGLVDERTRPLPLLLAIWGKTPSQAHDPGLTAQLVRPRQRALRNHRNAPPRQEVQTPLQERARNPPSTLSEMQRGTIARVKYFEEYGFVRGETGDHYFKKSDLADSSEWPFLRVGTSVSFRTAPPLVVGKAPQAKNLRMIGSTPPQADIPQT